MKSTLILIGTIAAALVVFSVTMALAFGGGTTPLPSETPTNLQPTGLVPQEVEEEPPGFGLPSPTPQPVPTGVDCNCIEEGW
jgi:hypothetical protein